MANRNTYTSGSGGPIPGPDYMDNVAGHLDRLNTAAVWSLTSVAGTANAITAVVDPTLPGTGLANGMKFTIQWAAENTGAATLSIGGVAAESIRRADGTAVVAGDLVAGVWAIIERRTIGFVVLTQLGTAGSSPGFQEFTADGTWTKPTLADDRTVLIEVWGAGGGAGGTDYGGGGGSYAWRHVRAGDLPSSVGVVVGAGGTYNATAASATDGGLSRFGGSGNPDYYVVAYGGEHGQSGAGRGAGWFIDQWNTEAGPMFYGAPGGDTTENGFPGVWGGGGGAGASGSTAGSSRFGGAGGEIGLDGAVPGGGGGANGGDGASGMVRVRVL